MADDWNNPIFGHVLCKKIGWAAYPSYQVPKWERRVPFLLVDLLTYLNYHLFEISPSTKLRNYTFWFLLYRAAWNYHSARN